MPHRPSQTPNTPDPPLHGGSSELPLESQAAVEAALAATRQLIARDRGLLGALRSRPTWQRVGAMCAAFGAAAASMSDGELRAELWLHGLLFGAGAWLLFWPLGRLAPRRTRALCVVAAVALPAAFAFWVHAHAARDAFGRSPWPCLAYGLLLAAPFLLLLKAFDRRAAIGAERALLAGSIAGLSGNALLHLHCADSDLGHVLLGHALLGLPCAAFAFWLGRTRRRLQPA